MLQSVQTTDDLEKKKDADAVKTDRYRAWKKPLDDHREYNKFQDEVRIDKETTDSKRVTRCNCERK